MINKLTTIFSVTFGIFLFTLVPLHAQRYSRITGKVTEASTGEELPGANIILIGTNLGASSDRFGDFTINNVPPGSYKLKASYIGYKDFQTSVEIGRGGKSVNVNVVLELSAVKINEVVVNGLLQGQTKALNQQMNAPNVKNVLSKEEMEKFPDMNTADVLQRVPGINISRSLGEGDYVYIRGTEPRLTQVTVNGQQLPSDNDQARTIDLGVVNSSQLASIEVNKTLTPDMDADAIGGSVNLVTKSPFEYHKNTLSVDAASGYAHQAAEPLYRTSATYTGFLGERRQFGFTINGSYYRDNIRGYSNETHWDQATDVDGNNIPFAVSQINLFDYNTHRDHYGASGDFEYRLDPDNTFYVRGMYNKMNDIQSRNNITYNISKGDYLTPTTISKSRMAFEFQNRNEIHNIVSASAGGKHLLGSSNLDYNFTYGWAEQAKQGPGAQIKSDWQLNQKPNVILNMNDPWFPKVTFTNMSESYAQDPANWGVDNQDFRATDIVDNTYTGTVNLKVPYSLGDLPGNIKIGGKFDMDKKSANNTRSKYKWKGNDNILMSTVASGTTVSDFLKGNYVFAPEIDNNLVWNFFNKYAGLNDGLRQYVTYEDPDGEGGDFTDKENIYAGYLMGTLNFGNLLVLAGLRDEYSHTNYKGIQIIYDNDGNFLNSVNVDNTRNYNDLFPYLQIRYQFEPKTNLRFAVTRSIARPNYSDLAPYNWIDPSSDLIQRGNPDLIPTISTNIDLMFGHYFQGIGVISAGLFYKNMDQIIYSRTFTQIGGQYDGFEIDEPVNGGSAKLYGVELDWQQQFTFLPGILSAFGIYGNYTYTKSKADLQYRDWNVLPGQAGDVGNVGLSFERYGITARLSLNYNAPVLSEVGISPDWDRYEAKHYQLDFAGIYQIFDNLSYYLNLINITNSPYREYIGNTSRPRVNEYYGWSVRSGLKFQL
jgi:TonB-dependent receptor